MKKNLINITILVSIIILFVNHTSSAKEINPDNLKYKEITSQKFFAKRDCSKWYSAISGYKITEVSILSITKNETESLLEFSHSLYSNKQCSVDITDFSEKENQIDSTLIERLKEAICFTDFYHCHQFNGLYTLYVYFEKGNKSKIILHNLESVPTQEEIDAAKTEKEEKWLAEEKERLEKEKERLEKEEAERKAKEEKLAQEAAKRKAIEERIKPLVKGYVYHGMDEEESNEQLFDSGALEEGHAYYISQLMLYAGGDVAGLMLISLFRQPNRCAIRYASQKVRGEVVSRGQTIFGTLPVSVIVAGGRIPTILGLAE